MTATATVSKTCTVSDAEKNGENNLNVHGGATLCLAESGGSNCLFLSTVLFTDNKSYWTMFLIDYSSEWYFTKNATSGFE